MAGYKARPFLLWEKFFALMLIVSAAFSKAEGLFSKIQKFFNPRIGNPLLKAVHFPKR
jgi:hypothetical protein